MSATAATTITSTATDALRSLLSVNLQPMIAGGSRRPFAWQAVVAGRCGRSFSALTAQLAPEQRPLLEMARIALAIEAAAKTEAHALVAIPLGAAAGMAEPLLAHLFRTALAHGIASERLVVEINADERGEIAPAAALAQACTERGLSVALDGFAAGPLALKLLARFTPRFVKLDPSLVRNIDMSASRRLIAEGVMRLARNMGVTVIARGAESRGEHAVLASMGVRHFQLEAPMPVPHLARHEPRSTAPAHRRLAHHQRAGFPLRAAAPAGAMMAAL